MNVTIKCKNCQSLLSVKEKRETYVYTCPKCDVNFRIKFRFGYMGFDLFIYIIPMLFACFLSGGDIQQTEIYYFIITVLLVSLFLYRPYSMKILND